MKQNKKQKIRKWLEYLKLFDDVCNTNSKELAKEIPLMIAIFQNFSQDIIQLTNTTKKVHADLAKTSDELRNTLEPYQIALLEKIQEYDFEIQDDREQQAFVYGYVTAIQLQAESRRQYRRYRNRSKRSEIQWKK